MSADGWDLSCPDWEQRLCEGRSLIRDDLPLDLIEGNRAVAIFDRLKLADVPGTPRLGARLPDDSPWQECDACGDWFRDTVRALFGSYDRAARRRMIREVFKLVPKKNSKTSYGALLMLVALLMNQRPRANFIMTAPVQDTAQMAFDQAAGAIALDPVLEKVLYVRHHLKTIVHRETMAELQIMTFDPAVLTGQKVSGGALIDELHVVAKMSKAASALRQLRGGMLPFPEAFLFTITTQSEEQPSGIFKSELDQARKVRDGEVRAPVLPILYELPLDVQADKAKLWKDPDLWHLVTPNLGRSITLEALIEDAAAAERKGEADYRAWASQHLNIQIGIALMASSWAGGEYWERQQRTEVTLEYILAECEVATIGIDGGGLDDLLGLAVTGRLRGSRKWVAWHHAWAHEIVLKRREEIAPRLLDFQKEGSLTIVKMPGQDVREVADICARVRAAGLLPTKNAIGVDAAGIGDILDELTREDDELDRGFSAEQIVGIQQGWRLNGAIKSTERKLAGDELIVDASDLMLWCVGNARAEDHGNAVVITKQVSGKAKIDPLMGLFDSATLLALNPVASSTKSFWQTDEDEDEATTTGGSGDAAEEGEELHA